MNKRTKQARIRLQKISEASSPEGKRQQKAQEFSKSRLIPFTSPSLGPSHKKYQSHTPEDRTKELNQIRQDIMDRRQRLNLWDEAFTSRQSKQSNPKQLVRILARGAIKMSQHPDIKLTLLRAARRGRLGLLLWLLNWLRQLFGAIRTMMAQRHLYSL